LWGERAAPVLAGPGSGKTRVLTARISRILNEAPNRNFRILALAFATKAATEMRERIERAVPGLGERTFIGAAIRAYPKSAFPHLVHLGARWRARFLLQSTRACF